ncbi:MAG: GNAT family N-acetyltransferase [Lysobacterales bacterium]
MRAFRTRSHERRPAELTLRDIVPSDHEFLAELYAAGRALELVPVPWSDEQKRHFLRDQFELQHAHYEKNYPGADRLLIELAGQAIGRIYVYRSPGEIRLMDIALVSERQQQGLGSALLAELIEEADLAGSTITLHVEADNPANRLYRRLGFEHIEDRGVYQFLGRKPRAPALS